MHTRLAPTLALFALSGLATACLPAQGNGSDGDAAVQAPRDAEASKNPDGAPSITLPDAAPPGADMATPSGDAAQASPDGTQTATDAVPGPDTDAAVPPPDAAVAPPDAAPPAGPCGDGTPVIDLNAALVGSDHFDGDLSHAPHAGVAGICGGAAGGEFVFQYHLENPVERLTFSTEHPETLTPAVLYLRTPSCDPAAEIACDRGSPAAPGSHLTLDEPAAGDYFLFVDTGSRDGGGPFRLSVDVVEIPQCRDTRDNDGDGRIDAADPGCSEANDPSEQDEAVAPICLDGQDNDGDGRVDYPDDPDCTFAGGPLEAPLCPDASVLVQAPAGGGHVALPVPPPGPGGASASCDPAAGPEIVVALPLAQASHVTVDVMENGAPVATPVYIRSDCRDPAAELGCAPTARNGHLRVEDVPAGQIYIFIEAGFGAAGPREVVITLESAVTECNDGLDNDFDGDIDLADTGCEGGRDVAEDNPPAPPGCADGIDNDGDGLTDWPDDHGCVGRGDLNEGGCTGSPLWQPVQCRIDSWVWSSDRNFPDLQTANGNRTLWSGCNHDGQNPNGLCSLDGTGWVSVDTYPMQGCDASWWHIGGSYTGACGGHDGDTVRHLALTEDDCWDYR